MVKISKAVASATSRALRSGAKPNAGLSSLEIAGPRARGQTARLTESERILLRLNSQNLDINECARRYNLETGTSFTVPIIKGKLTKALNKKGRASTSSETSEHPAHLNSEGSQLLRSDSTEDAATPEMYNFSYESDRSDPISGPDEAKPQQGESMDLEEADQQIDATFESRNELYMGSQDSHVSPSGSQLPTPTLSTQGHEEDVDSEEELNRLITQASPNQLDTQQPQQDLPHLPIAADGTQDISTAITSGRWTSRKRKFEEGVGNKGENELGIHRSKRLKSDDSSFSFESTEEGLSGRVEADQAGRKGASVEITNASSNSAKAPVRPSTSSISSASPAVQKADLFKQGDTSIESPAGHGQKTNDLALSAASGHHPAGSNPPGEHGSDSGEQGASFLTETGLKGQKLPDLVPSRSKTTGISPFGKRKINRIEEGDEDCRAPCAKKSKLQDDSTSFSNIDSKSGAMPHPKRSNASSAFPDTTVLNVPTPTELYSQHRGERQVRNAPTYFPVGANRWPDLQIYFDSSAADIADKCSTLFGATYDRVSELFDWWDADFVEKDQILITRDLAFRTRRVLEILTKQSGKDARHCLLDALDNKNSTLAVEGGIRPLTGSKLAASIFAAMMYEEVWSQELGPQLEVPKTDGIILTILDHIKREAGQHALFGKPAGDDAEVFRYIWRDLRHSWTEQKCFTEKRDALAERILSRFESDMHFIARDPGERFGPRLRGLLLQSIKAAIVFKCKLETYASRYEFRWVAPCGMPLDRSLMNAWDSEITQNPHKLKIREDLSQRVRFAFSPALFEHPVCGRNELRMDATEREQRMTRLKLDGTKDEGGAGGFLPEKCIFKARIFLFDGLIWKST